MYKVYCKPQGEGLKTTPEAIKSFEENDFQADFLAKSSKSGIFRRRVW
jgi:hypothetical protein